MRRLLALLLVPACLMCSGCDEFSTEDDDVRSEAKTEESATDCDNTHFFGVGECKIKLHDGRRMTCVIMVVGDNRNGLSCDWAHATIKETK